MLTFWRCMLPPHSGLKCVGWRVSKRTGGREGSKVGIEAASELVGQWPRKVVQTALSGASECMKNPVNNLCS
jgi:hypothetical protein